MDEVVVVGSRVVGYLLEPALHAALALAFPQEGRVDGGDLLSFLPSGQNGLLHLELEAAVVPQRGGLAGRVPGEHERRVALDAGLLRGRAGHKHGEAVVHSAGLLVLLQRLLEVARDQRLLLEELVAQRLGRRQPLLRVLLQQSLEQTEP